MDDKQLVKEIGRNNDEAFGLLIKKYEKLVYNTSYKLLQNSSDSEDICQEVFLKVYHSIHQLRNEDDLAPWLFRIAFNKSVSFLRKKNPAKIRGNNNLDSEFLNNSLVEKQTPDITLEQKESSEQLFMAIERLPNAQKKALLLHKFENHSHKEICDLMNLSKASVESLIYRAKANLRKSLFHYFNNNLKNTL
jgi:RNA polymerase sigma factor (sigma-70 family)